MEVIQRGRAAVRPAPVPLLNVVPAISDSELSEPEYVLTVRFSNDARTLLVVHVQYTAPNLNPVYRLF